MEIENSGSIKGPDFQMNLDLVCQADQKLGRSSLYFMHLEADFCQLTQSNHGKNVL